MATRCVKCKIADLIGLTMTKVEVKRDVDNTDYNDELVFTSTDGRVFKFYHNQDCCETVYIESIVGDLNDLVGSPIVIASESSNGPIPDDFDRTKHESITWTFYKFATINGYVDVRWLGESNGYYSEEVDFCEVVEYVESPKPPKNVLIKDKQPSNPIPETKITKELTIAEVEDLLGFSVKIIH